MGHCIDLLIEISCLHPSLTSLLDVYEGQRLRRPLLTTSVCARTKGDVAEGEGGQRYRRRRQSTVMMMAAEERPLNEDST